MRVSCRRVHRNQEQIGIEIVYVLCIASGAVEQIAQ
jgi:hypothetical protein